MADWMEKHFGVPDPPKRLREQHRDGKGLGFWFFLFLLIAAPIAFVAVGYWLGFLDPKEKIVVERVIEPAAAAPAPKPAPQPAKLPAEPAPEPERKTVTQARANELNRLIASRDSGINLMTRDRAKEIAAKKNAELALMSARDRLFFLEKNRPSSNDTRATYEWNLSHDASVAAAKNATATITAKDKVIASFDNRIEKAEAERAAAKEELKDAEIIP